MNWQEMLERVNPEYLTEAALDVVGQDLLVMAGGLDAAMRGIAKGFGGAAADELAGRIAEEACVLEGAEQADHPVAQAQREMAERRRAAAEALANDPQRKAVKAQRRARQRVREAIGIKSYREL